MTEYEFIFVVDGFSLDDHDEIETLGEELGAIVSSFHEVLRMSVSGEGENAVAAAQSVMKLVHGVAPELRFVRLHRDLVSVSDIAELTGRTRQNVDQWVRGQRHDETPFPHPETVVGRSMVWLWAEVNKWLRTIGLDDGLNWPSRDEMTEIDWGLKNVRPVRLNLVFGRARDDVRRLADQLAEHARTNQRFVHYLVGNPQVRDERGSYTIFVCSPADQATDVFRRLEAFDHPVVLATVNQMIHALVMESGGDRGGKTTELVPGMTVRDWLGMIALSPESEFTVAAEGTSTKVATISARSPMDLVGV